MGPAPILYKLARKDPEFERFVIKHIDDTASLDDLKEIFAHATRSCFPGGENFCKGITKHLCEGQKEANSDRGAVKWRLVTEKQFREFCR